MGLSLRECRLPALMIASILYGFNVVTFCLSLQRLFGGRGDRKRGRDINFPLAAVVIVLFMSSTTSLALHLTLVMREYMFLSQSSPHPEEFERKRRTIVVAKATLAIFETMIADSVLLYRCWLIWNKMFLAIVLPIFLWMGCLGSSIYALHCLYFRLSLSPTPIGPSEKTFPGLAAFWTCTIVINIYCTGMIVGRIYSVQKGWKPPTICSLRDIPQRTRMQLAKRIFIDSAMMYTLASLSVFVSQICQSVAVDITFQAQIQITAIAFNLILIRPGPGEDHENELCARCCKPETNGSKVSVAVGTTDSSVDIPLFDTSKRLRRASVVE